MTTEEMVRADARKRGWEVVRASQELGVTGVPCFVEPTVPGRCQIWVGMASDSDQLHGGLGWQGGNIHVAEVRGLTKGSVYDRAGKSIGNVVRTSNTDRCTISIKRDGGDYQNAWEALRTYINAIYGGFRNRHIDSAAQVERPYTFPILGEKNREEVEWLDLVRGEKIAIVGLGGVGSWIADLMTKTDVAEVHGWDADVIEDKNIIRMPGAVNPEWIGKPKATWFKETYRQIHRGVCGYSENVCEKTIEEMRSKITFGFVAVDNDEGRGIACEALADAGVPFVDVGLALDRKDGQVSAAVRVITAYPPDETWRKAIPKVDRSGQEVYGRLELSDVAAMAAGWAVQSWRKMRGQMAQADVHECMVYRAECNSITVRSRGEVTA